MDTLKRIADGLQRGDDGEVAERVRHALDDGLAPSRILDEGLIAGMNVVGERFRVHKIFLPEVLLAAKAMQAGMALLEPLLVGEAAPRRGRVVVGSVQGDLHDIGKNLVGVMLQGAGYDVIDLGHDVPPERFVETAVERDAPVIGMSALLTTTMSAMKQVVDLVEERGLAGSVKTIVGGAPVSEEFAREIGADAYGYDASSAVERVKELLGQA
jgi:5-methyltetrahydrofolate--homocysteine methyltransferase